MRGAVLVGAFCAALALSACDKQQADATQQQPRPVAQQAPDNQQRVLAALDPCAASTGFAHSVCANRNLATLDAQIRGALATRAVNVSDAGARVLVDNQQHWREAQRVACGVANAEPDATQEQCLENRFRARAQDVALAVQSMGGYTFQSVEAVSATPAPRASLPAGGSPAIVSDIRYPRIDGPQTPQVQRFNALMQQPPQVRPSDGANETVRYRIVYAGPALISVRFDSSTDSPGAAQTSTNVKAVTVVMATGQALEAADIFRANSGWEDFLTQRAVRDIATQFHDYDNFTPPVRDVHETATKPHLWLITDRALVLLFPSLSFGGSYDMGGAEVTIPWADLRPYLSPTAPSPIRPQA